MKAPKILVFGADAVGIEVASQLLKRTWAPLLVDNDADFLASAEAKGIATAKLDYTDDDELRRIGVGEDVDIVFSMFEDDAKNIFLTISVLALDSKVQVVSLTHSHDAGEKLKAAGATKVIDPYEISGHKILDLIKRPLIVEAMEEIVYGDKHLNMAEIEVAVGSSFDGVYVEEMDISRRYNLVLLGIVDRELGDEFMFSTTMVDHKIDSGDVMVVIGPPAEIEKFRNAANPG
jgi:voltage-gated potassium channel